MDFWAAFSRLCTKNYLKFCLAKDNSCSSGISRCHSISSSAVLGKISEAGHVTIVEFEKGKTFFDKRGVNQASTFTGFCGFHDTVIFRQLDLLALTATDIVSPEILNLMNLRSVARELWSKKNGVEFYKKVLAGLDGLPGGMTFRPVNEKTIRGNRKILEGFKHGTGKGIQELERAFQSLNRIRETRNFHLYRKREYVIPGPIPLCASNAITTQFSLTGKRLLYPEMPDWDQMYIHVIPFEDHGRVVFSWHKRFDNVINEFLQPVEEASSRSIHDLQCVLSKILCVYAENVAIKPSHVSRWSEEHKELYLRDFNETIHNLSRIGLLKAPNMFSGDLY
jgi:hypothetical protein